MRNARCYLLLIATTAACFAQGPSVVLVVGGADYSDAVSVGIPLGSIFTIEGSDLAPSVAQATGLPLPTTLNGLTVQIWDSAGSAVLGVCPLWYVSPTQVNAVLPSSLAAGTYDLSVSILTASPFGNIPLSTPRVQILATNGRFAPFTLGSRGFGPAVVQQYDSAGGPFLNQLTAAAPTGSVLVLWGTGLV